MSQLPPFSAGRGKHPSGSLKAAGQFWSFAFKRSRAQLNVKPTSRCAGCVNHRRRTSVWRVCSQRRLHSASNLKTCAGVCLLTPARHGACCLCCNPPPVRRACRDLAQASTLWLRQAGCDSTAQHNTPSTSASASAPEMHCSWPQPYNSTSPMYLCNALRGGLASQGGPSWGGIQPPYGYMNNQYRVCFAH